MLSLIPIWRAVVELVIECYNIYNYMGNSLELYAKVYPRNAIGTNLWILDVFDVPRQKTKVVFYPMIFGAAC
jgi:hypothetical protein